MPDNEYLEIGRILNTHGVRGEVKLEPWADTPEQLLRLRTVRIDGADRSCAFRIHSRFLLLKLVGVDSVEAAMPLKGKTVLAHRDALPLEEGACFIRDLIGLPVVTEEGATLGVLKDVLEYPAGNLYVVQGETERLIPENGGFIRSLDPAAGQIVVRLIEGL